MKLIKEYTNRKEKRSSIHPINTIAPHDPEKLKNVYSIVSDMLDSTDEVAIKMLLGGFENDLEKMLDNIVKETYRMLYGFDYNKTNFIPNNGMYLKEISDAVEEQMKIYSLTYFNSTVLGMEINWHHIEWGWLIEEFTMTCILAARDHGKCLAKGTKVVMYDGSLKKVEDIRVGDKLMGADSTCRNVLSLHSGYDNMYKIKQSRGDDYVVNSEHILSIYNRRKKDFGIQNIELKDLMNLTDWVRKTYYRGYKVVTHFEKRKITIDPYYFGLWLGDGNSNGTTITTMDKEIKEFIYDYAKYLNLDVSVIAKGENNSSKGYRICNKNNIRSNKKIKFKKGKRRNILIRALDFYNVLENKHIPEDYLYNTEEVRLKLLAGLTDSDGYVKDNCIRISSKFETLAKDIKRLADSLGFMTVLKKNTKFVKVIGKNYTGYSICISGNTYKVPIKVERKKIHENKNVKNHKQPKKLNGYDVSILSSILKIEDVGRGEYYGFTIDGDNLFLLEDNTVTHNSYYISYGYPAWKAYGYDKRSRNVRRLNGKRGIIFSNTSSQVVEIIETLREGIEDNDELKERLYPRQKETWSKTAIKTRNGCIIRGRSMNSTTRGAHPGYIVLDDVLKDNVLYSKTQRERNKDFFNSSILPMLIPGGEMRVVGTPFHQNDLYALFREGIDFAYREYPAIDDKGNLLWASRHSLADLEMRKRIQGTTIFTREFLVKPISNFNSLFPQNILDRSKYKNISYVNNIEASEIKNFVKVVTAGDFAISGSVGADFTVFVTFGIDENENMWLLNIFRKKGMTFEEQKLKLKSIWRAFKSDIVLLENNQFQEIYSQSLKAETQMPVKGYTTTIRKNDLANGVPGLALLFENGKFRFPYKTDEDKKTTDEIYEEFLNIVFTDKGVAASVGNHDDIPMAIYIAKEAVFMTVIKNQFLYDFVGDDSNDIENLDKQYLQQSFNQYNIY